MVLKNIDGVDYTVQEQIANAYFIKLGEEGEWEESSIRENKMRFGWKYIRLSDIIEKNWSAISPWMGASAASAGDPAPSRSPTTPPRWANSSRGWTS